MHGLSRFCLQVSRDITAWWSERLDGPHSLAREAVIGALARLQAAFPLLTMDFDPHPANTHLDLAATFRRQPGLAFDIFLHLQGDSLHLEVPSLAAFHVEYFPCDDPERLGMAIDDVRGLLAGEYRIVAYEVGNSLCEELQKPIEGGWPAPRHPLLAPESIVVTKQIIQNTLAG
jgi:hypothetical protein